RALSSRADRDRARASLMGWRATFVSATTLLVFAVLWYWDRLQLEPWLLFEGSSIRPTLVLQTPPAVPAGEFLCLMSPPTRLHLLEGARAQTAPRAKWSVTAWSHQCLKSETTWDALFDHYRNLHGWWRYVRVGWKSVAITLFVLWLANLKGPAFLGRGVG